MFGFRKKQRITSDAELTIRHLGQNRLTIQAHWTDTENVFNAMIECDPNTSISTLFQLVETGRQVGEEKVR